MLMFNLIFLVLSLALAYWAFRVKSLAIVISSLTIVLTLCIMIARDL